MATDPNVSGRLMQWEDLKPHEQAVVAHNMRQAGTNLPQSIETQIGKAQQSSNKKADVQENSLRAIQPHVRSEPVTLQRAANSRQRLYQDAQARQQTTAGPESHNVTPAGADWYFEHNARIAHSADQHGFPHDWAHTASAVMSPQNSPENERGAVKAIMDAHATGTVHVSQAVSDHLGRNGVDVSQHVGQTVHHDQLPAGALAHLSTSGFRDQVQSTANLREVARGGTKGNVTKAEQVLMGDVRPQDATINANGAVTGLKVGSYDHVIRAAQPGSATHVEFAGRVHQDAAVRAGHIGADQQALDLYGHNDQKLPNDHLLSPRSHTVEDTWQNAVTFNQPKVMGGEGGKTSVFKAGGSGAQYPPSGLKIQRDENNKVVGRAHEDSRVNDGMLLHTFNNKATRKAAEQQSRGSGTTVPPVAVQGVAWTEARIQAGKSRDQTAGAEASSGQMTGDQYKTEVDVHRRMGRTVPNHVRELQETHTPFEQAHPGQVKGQGALFGDHLPGASRTPLDRSADRPKFEGHKEPVSEEADIRKWAAIGNSVHAARARRGGIV